MGARASVSITAPKQAQAQQPQPSQTAQTAQKLQKQKQTGQKQTEKVQTAENRQEKEGESRSVCTSTGSPFSSPGSPGLSPPAQQTRGDISPPTLTEDSEDRFVADHRSAVTDNHTLPEDIHEKPTEATSKMSTNAASLTAKDGAPSKDGAPAKDGGFLAKLASANQDVICMAGGAQVGVIDVSRLLQKRLRIPLFQRRYCWESPQWSTLLGDIERVANGLKGSHDLGRITCAIQRDASQEFAEGGAERLIVIDGQQRNTTTVLLLAALRDLADERGDATFSQTLNKLIFPDDRGFAAWQLQGSSVKEGEALEFCVLVPTYCDREAFGHAVLPKSLRGRDVARSGTWMRPLEAKQFFYERLQGGETMRLHALLDVILHKLKWLFFPIDIGRGSDDGTEDLPIIFERLALRDAMFCVPLRKSEAANMGAADFVRNLLLGSFAREEVAVAMYTGHWLKLEKTAGETAARQEVAVAAILETLLAAFLKTFSQSHPSQELMPVVIGGALYPRFRAWLSGELDADSPSADGDKFTAAAKSAAQRWQMSVRQEKTVVVLCQLIAFAEVFCSQTVQVVAEDAGAGGRRTSMKISPPLPPSAFQAADSLNATGFGGRMGQVKQRMAQGGWNCATCRFRNPVERSSCITCLKPRASPPLPSRTG